MYLTAKEISYLSDTDFLTTKKQIQQKINTLLVRTEETLKKFIQEQSLTFPEDVAHKAGKIAKGENYQHLPYHILDFPRLFRRKDIFALRTMCWWGHFFSVTLHLQGHSWEKFKPKLIQKRRELYRKEFYLCIHAHPWEYHRGDDNYQKLDSLAETEISQRLSEMPFLKIAVFLPLEQGENLPDFALNFLQFFADMLEL